MWKKDGAFFHFPEPVPPRTYAMAYSVSDGYLAPAETL